MEEDSTPPATVMLSARHKAPEIWLFEDQMICQGYKVILPVLIFCYHVY